MVRVHDMDDRVKCLVPSCPVAERRRELQERVAEATVPTDVVNSGSVPVSPDVFTAANLTVVVHMPEGDLVYDAPSHTWQLVGDVGDTSDGVADRPDIG